MRIGERTGEGPITRMVAHLIVQRRCLPYDQRASTEETDGVGELGHHRPKPGEDWRGLCEP